MNNFGNISTKYTNFKNPGSFTSIQSFKRNNEELKENDIKTVLTKLPTYTLHKNIYKNFKRQKTFVPTIDDTWQIDLIDVSKLKNKKFKQNYNFILTVLDCFSRKAWAEPIKTKHSTETTIALKKIFEGSNQKPKRIYSDEGNEFLGLFKKLLEKEKIQQIFSKSKHKAAMVERFNRTLKGKMYKVFSFRKNNIYIDILQDLISSYNNSYHRSIKTSPNSVTKNNEKQIFDIQYKNIFSTEKAVKIAYPVGSYVRKMIEKKLFDKGYTPNWSEDIFLIYRIIPKNPIRYRIKKLNDNKNSYILNKDFYEHELQRVEQLEFPYDSYEILAEKGDKILAKRLNDSENQTVWYSKTFFENEPTLSDSFKEQTEHEVKQKTIFEKRITRSKYKNA